VGPEKKDRFLEEIFPIGGHNNAQSETSQQFRKKFYEAYHYKDPTKSGR